MVPLTISLTDVLFVWHLQAWEFQTQELKIPDQELGGEPQGTHLTQEGPSCSRQFATTTTMQSATAHTAITSINVTTAEVTTRSGAASPVGSPGVNKPLPWTPLRSFVLERELSNHPNKVFVRQLINNLRHGCTIGYEGPQFTYFATNLQSASQQPKVIDITITEECKAGRILGPFQHPPLPNFRTSGLGLVPKHDGGWRIIYHLSAPQNFSINDFIDPSLYSLSYCTIDNAYRIINTLGPGALMSKIDLKNAFCLIPVRLKDWNLLEICWRHQFYVDTCLPFGLRSAPHIFNELSTSIHWILQHTYGIQNLLHYLDDFFTAGLSTSQCVSRTCKLCLHCVTRSMHPLRCRKWKALPPP